MIAQNDPARATTAAATTATTAPATTRESAAITGRSSDFSDLWGTAQTQPEPPHDPQQQQRRPAPEWVKIPGPGAEKWGLYPPLPTPRAAVTFRRDRLGDFWEAFITPDALRDAAGAVLRYGSCTAAMLAVEDRIEAGQYEEWRPHFTPPPATWKPKAPRRR